MLTHEMAFTRWLGRFPLPAISHGAVASALDAVTEVAFSRGAGCDDCTAGRDDDCMCAVKQRIQNCKESEIGRLTNNPDVLRKHYRWLQHFEIEIRRNGLPKWLRHSGGFYTVMRRATGAAGG